MLSSVFPTLYDMSAGASHLIIAVLLFRFFVRKFPKKYILLLWAVVLFRLLCPLQPTSSLSMIPQESVSFARDTTLEERSEISVLSAADAALRAIGDAANGGLDTICIDLDRADAGVIEESADTSGIPDTASPSDTAPQFVSAYHDQVWLLFLEKIYPLGILVLLGYQIVSILRLRGHLRTAVPYPGAIPDGILPQGCEILYADSIPSAFVMGIFRPRIYLPSERMSGTAQDDPALLYVLAHEGVHLRRRDPLWKTLWFLALCLHWYHPFVWAAFFCVSADLEYRCDEDALRVLASVTGQPQDDRAAPYAEALLTLSTAKRRPLGMLSLDAGNVSGRIRRLLGSKPKRAMCAIMAVCCLFLCLMGIGNPPTKYPVDNIVACTLDGQQITPEHGIALVDALNGASRTVNRSYDAVGQGTLDHLAVVTYADGSYLEINYLYVSGYSFNPAHPGEDDYKTVVWHRHPTGEVIGTWVMEYDFDAVFREWMTDSKALSIDSYDWYFERGFLRYESSEQTLELYHPALQPETQESVPMNVVLMRRDEDEGSRYEFITGDWDINRSTLHFRRKESDTDTVQYDVDVYRDTGEFLHTVTAVMEWQDEKLPPVLKLSSITEDGTTQWIFTADRLETENNGTAQLTLDDVILLSKKNVGLTWEDFAPYKSVETGSGLYIRVYEIDETFELWIGGGSPIGTPMYIYLARADDLDSRIDIRYGGVEEFIEEIKAETILRATSDSEIGIAVVMLDDRQSMDVPLLPVAYDRSVDYDRVPEITVHDGAVIAISGIGTESLSVSEDYYEARFSDSTFIDRQTMQLTADEDGIYRFPVTHRHPGKAEHAVYYIGADAYRYVFRIRFIGEE